MSSADNLLVIIDDILDFTKIESGKMELEEQLVVLPKVTHAIIESCRPKFEKKSIEVKLNIEPNVPTHFLGDKTRLHQILLNLFNNAIKFTQKGSITIGVQLLEELEKSVHLRFYVADTGIGIPKEKVEQIFSPFTQASSDTTRKFGGTGLGLSISRQLVELHGGNMYLNSEVGKGSTFSFEIRYNKHLEPIPTKTATPPKNGTAPALPSLKQNGIKPKILLAEDNEVNQMLMMQLLSQWDIEIELAKNGKQAIELLKNQDFSLILMDVHMPELDGYGATKYIRAHFPMPKRAIPIIAITASALKGEAEKCQAAGMDDYISKPVKKELLYRKIADNVQTTQLYKE